MKVFIYCLLLLSFGYCSLEEKKTCTTSQTANVQTSKQYHYEIIKVANGWGYRIFVNNTLYIEQLNIPAIEGIKPFKDSKQAQKMAEVVIKKVQKSADFPTISVKELDSLKINWNY